MITKTHLAIWIYMGKTSTAAIEINIILAGISLAFSKKYREILTKGTMDSDKIRYTQKGVTHFLSKWL